MAQRRMISKTISTSKKVNRLSDAAALLYTWIIPHTDDYGRMDGDAATVKAKACPMRKWAESQIERALVEMEELGLIARYWHSGDQYLEILNFDTFQTFKTDRARNAECPSREEADGNQRIPNGNQSVPTSAEDKLREVNLSKGKGSGAAETAAAPALTPRERATSFFEGVLALQGGGENETLKAWLQMVVEKTGARKDVLWREIQNFTRHWTEKNSTGTKERWQMQQTFEVEKRLQTWFRRAGFENPSTAGLRFTPQSRGKEIISSV